MRKSLSTKLFLVILAVVLGSISIVVTLNGLLLEDYYLEYKRGLLIKTFELTNQYYLTYDEELLVTIDQLAERNSFAIAVDRNYEKVVLKLASNGLASVSGDIIDQIQTLANFIEVGDLTRNDYIIYEERDPRLNTKQLMLYGRLMNGDYLGLRTPYESISHLAIITNMFFIRVGTIIAIIAAILVYLIARRFVRPILQMSVIARDMAELDFSKKYCNNLQDEVGVLGNSINTLSSKLEKTISELKTANLKLKEDILEKQAVDEMRRGFLSNISHELKTPIALIQGYAEGLKDSVVAEEDKEYYYDVILDESEKMGQLIKRIMALMQLEAGQDQIMIRHFDVEQLIKQELEKNKLLFKQKNIELIFSSELNQLVWADELFVEDVIRNYLSNAINHVSEGGKIVITINNIQSRTRISVYNTGETIPTDELDKIWTSFYKVDKARTREYGGSGIGLAVVAGIMKAHNMPYGVNNREDGVEFYIELDSKNGV